MKLDKLIFSVGRCSVKGFAKLANKVNPDQTDSIKNSVISADNFLGHSCSQLIPRALTCRSCFLIYCRNFLLTHHLHTFITYSRTSMARTPLDFEN